jgi:hypothetical protein
MHARRLRALLSSIIVSGGVVLLTVGPSAAATCGLSAPASVAIGSALTISATGFPVSAPVDISITIEGKAPDTFTTQSDPTGKFAINLQPEAADQGMTTVTATSGTDCTAQAVIAVGVAPSTPEPTDDGGVAAGGGAPPPTTDAAPALTSTTGQGTAIWLGLLLFALGIGGLIVSKPARSR